MLKNIPLLILFLFGISSMTFSQNEEVSNEAEPTGVHFDGLYYAKTREVQIGDVVSEIYTYIRFKEDGTVYVQSVNADDPTAVAKWLGVDGKAERHGVYTLEGKELKFTVSNDDTVDQKLEGPKTDIYFGELMGDNTLYLVVQSNSGDQMQILFKFAETE
ncbi:MAG: hypothetical protein QNK23_11490 [Crocinitomicaceae bacterium]|nr:hypothetical protein [Crocinitomicaceae bacterium]